MGADGPSRQRPWLVSPHGSQVRQPLLRIVRRSQADRVPFVAEIELHVGKPRVLPKLVQRLKRRGRAAMVRLINNAARERLQLAGDAARPPFAPPGYL